ncbi:MAG: efflux transporter periplasmic adaptor subunit [Candidatus Methylumidiphilus alinenensis]|uniref:Efflux transporter periplasmic adaptor subunit n=1 Tax=Candidatus Methylumidiphilus alinenensis TaxID=2202197 RepID=A0A2W4QTD9_9GAMM|nr:MAG: efflux transporter periplasmic adaptor subunit [Candidatus Methylumidiphilus alinenensis]
MKRNQDLAQGNPYLKFISRPILLSAVCALIFTGCENKAKEQQKLALAATPPPPVVEYALVSQQDVPIYDEWVGTLDGMVNAQILAQVTGYLVKQVYKEGEFVKKGQLLYQIDPRTFQAALDQAKGNLARQEALLITTRLDMQRIQRLLPENAVSVRDRDIAVGREAQAQAEVAAAKAAMESAQLALGFTRILSPIDGIAGISQAQLGNLVGPGSANAVLTKVSTVDPIKAFIPLSEQQYMRFAREERRASERSTPTPLELILADGTKYPLPGKFFFADRQVEVKTGTIQVASLFPNPRNILRPGQFARVRAATTIKRGALLVPQRAVGDIQGRKVVAVVKPDNTVEIRPVKPAETIGTQWVIDEGLKPGERVVAEGILKVRPGSKVNPRPFAEAPAAAGR